MALRRRITLQGEAVVGIVYNAEGQVGRLSLPKMYDLIFTDRRIVGAVTAKPGAAGAARGGLGGPVRARARRWLSLGRLGARRGSRPGRGRDSRAAPGTARP